MDCGNYSISWILSEIDHDFEQSDFIFSEVFSWVSLLPKIWIILLKYFSDVEIIHEHQDVFINIKNEELPLLQEYAHWLDEFQKLWWKYSNREINIEFLKENLEVDIISFEGEILGVNLPDKIELEIIDTEPAVKGNTTNNATKDAVLETELVTRVPLFIENDEVISVYTADGKYASRA